MLLEKENKQEMLLTCDMITFRHNWTSTDGTYHYIRAAIKLHGGQDFPLQGNILEKTAQDLKRKFYTNFSRY